MKSNVLIVGAGLSGLYTAYLLKQQNIDVTVVEARSRTGGRVLSKSLGNLAGVDLGPSWFWPWQTRMLALLKELKLDTHIYEQYSQGLSVAEYRTGQRVQQSGDASMAGSLRLSGGLQTLAARLSELIGAENISYDYKITAVNGEQNNIVLSADYRGSPHTLTANQVVLAAPPRVLANTIQFSPALNPSEKQLMDNTPTWMAAQAKFVAVYESAFWRDKGLSGDGVSEIGPLGEIHDASAAIGAPHALFGFVGLPVSARTNRDGDVIQAATEQLARMFGDGTEKPIHVFYKDWSNDDLTATDADRNGPRSHAHQTVTLDGLWENRLFWAGSETAPISSGDNGYVEGALAAAQRVAELIKTPPE